MHKKKIIRWVASMLAFAALPQALAAAPDGNQLFNDHCATCHAAPRGRMPSKDMLAQRAPEEIFLAVIAGIMQPERGDLSEDDLRAIATALTGKAPGTIPQPDPAANMCKAPGGPIDLKDGHWSGWGRDVENSRYQPDPGLKAADVSKLKLKWAFAYPGYIIYGQPAVAGHRVFVTSAKGLVFALNADTGCTYWSYDNHTATRSAISIGEIQAKTGKTAALWFGDDKGAVTALDAATGKELWKVQVDRHPMALITGAPKLDGNRLYVPVSSNEEVAGLDNNYACCTFRGSIAVLDAATGKELWQSYTIAEEAKVFKKNAAGADIKGPAGVAIWTSPTIDAKHGLVYAATGDSYTDKDVDDSDAIIALDAKTGTRKWLFQAVAKDNYLVDCPGADGVNCPSAPGPDVDFNASPILRTQPNGKAIVLATSKTGEIYALDPAQNGKLLWKRKLGDANPIGGIGWGSTADDTNVYVAYWAGFMAAPGTAPGGITALNIVTGEPVWNTVGAAPSCGWGPVNCFNGQLSALAGIPGAVFSGSLDGHLRAYSTKDGSVLWDVDTFGRHDSVNGVPAQGGSINFGGPVVADGKLFVNSGYGRFIGKSGNALLVYSVDGK